MQYSFAIFRWKNEGTVGSMSYKELQKYYVEVRQEGYREGPLEVRKEIIKELDKMGMSIEQIGRIVKTPVETVSQWIEQQTEN